MEFIQNPPHPYSIQRVWQSFNRVKIGGIVTVPLGEIQACRLRMNHISALPDDLLLLILARLELMHEHCRAHSFLSCRWHGLWPYLHEVSFCDASFPSHEAALDHIRVPKYPSLKPMYCRSAWPKELVFTLLSSLSISIAPRMSSHRGSTVQPPYLAGLDLFLLVKTDGNGDVESTHHRRLWHSKERGIQLQWWYGSGTVQAQDKRWIDR